MPEKTKQNKKNRFPPTASTYPEGHSKLVLMIRLCAIDMYNSFKLRALCVTGKSKVAIKIHLCKSFTHTHTSAHTHLLLSLSCLWDFQHLLPEQHCLRGVTTFNQCVDKQ